jgi:hypothetical protein
MRALAVAMAVLLALPLETLALQAQTEAADAVNEFSTEQLDALLAPIALYPDPLLTQVLMASTFPLEIVDAARWLAIPANAKLTGDALTKALGSQSWDPSVKSLVPFPTVLDQLNTHLDWTQQLGYAFATQQADVLNSVQRLRQQAQTAGHLQSNDQLVVATQSNAITIEPANPQVVYVPSYNPQVVFGSWPYPSSPPVFFPPPVSYGIGPALATGLAFGAGVAITAGLWNLARPNWGWRGSGGYGGVSVNVNNWNRVNVNRPPLQNGNWRPSPAGRPGSWNPGRPPVGPVGVPSRRNGVPAGAIGRPNVQVPGSAVNRPNRPQGTSPPLRRPGDNGQRPGGGGNNLPQRPGAGGGPAQRPGGGAANRPSAPSRGDRGGAFGGMNDGGRNR